MSEPTRYEDELVPEPQALELPDDSGYELGEPYLGDAAEGAYPARPLDDAVDVQAAVGDRTNDELKAELKALGLPVGGRKDELEARLAAHHAGPGTGGAHGIGT